MFGLDSASRSVSWVCVCVCTAVGMCSSTCILCTAFRMSTRANVLSLPYPLRRLLGYHGRCTYSLVLVPRAGTFCCTTTNDARWPLAYTKGAATLGMWGSTTFCWISNRKIIDTKSRSNQTGTIYYPGSRFNLLATMQNPLAIIGRPRWIIYHSNQMMALLVFRVTSYPFDHWNPSR